MEDFISNKIGISDNFLSIDLAKKLKGNLNDLLNHQKLKNAGIGNLVDFQNDKLIRNLMNFIMQYFQLEVFIVNILINLKVTTADSFR